MAKRANSPNRLLVAILVVSIIFSSYSIYSLFIQTQEQSATIQSLGGQLLDKSNAINELNIKAESLTLDVSNLNSQLKSRELAIKDLSTRLGITQSEVEELTPVVKTYFALGVSGNKGIVIPLEVKMSKGTGIVSVNIKNVELKSDAQESIRIATKVSQDYTGVDLSEKDITVTFVNDNPFIVSLDGPSAGAAITLTIIAGVLDRTPSNVVLITGTIESNGDVGPVGGIEEKASAAASEGAQIFLVPVGQKVNSPGIEVAEVKKIQEVVNLVLK